MMNDNTCFGIRFYFISCCGCPWGAVRGQRQCLIQNVNHLCKSCLYYSIFMHLCIILLIYLCVNCHTNVTNITKITNKLRWVKVNKIQNRLSNIRRDKVTVRLSLCAPSGRLPLNLEVILVSLFFPCKHLTIVISDFSSANNINIIE